jgi:hypothetical protein
MMMENNNTRDPFSVEMAFPTEMDPFLSGTIQSSYDRFFSRMMDQQPAPLPWNQQAEFSQEESPLEPSPINTRTMKVVERLDWRGSAFTFAGNDPFPFFYSHQLYHDSSARTFASNHHNVSKEEELLLPGNSTNESHVRHVQTQQHVLGTTVEALVLARDGNSENSSNKDEDEELICYRPQRKSPTAEDSRLPVSHYGHVTPLLEDVRSQEVVSPSKRGARDQNHSDRWNDKFTELRAFIRTNCHARVPVRYKLNLPLSKWAKRQRYQWRLKHECKHSTLSDIREAKLDEVGFLWDIRLTVWEERFEELVEFRKTHGHSNVPISCVEHPKLGTWVKCQRRQWKLRCNGQQSSMTSSRIIKLEAIGFSWEGR